MSINENTLRSLQNEVSSLNNKVESITINKREVDFQIKELTKLRDEFDITKREVDTLQIQAAEAQTPWYKEPSIIISLLAFVFSLGTTVVSYWESHQKDIRDKKIELRGLTQRLTNLPIENAKTAKEYQDDPSVYGQVSSFLNTENALLASQAVHLIKQLPKNQISGADYSIVSNALLTAGIYDTGREFLEKAIEVSDRQNDFFYEIGARRNLASNLMISGDVEAGRQHYQEALNIFEKYPTANQYYQNFTNASTEMFWAQAELSAGYCDEAKLHIQQAKEHAMKLATPNVPNPILNQVLQTEQYIAGCATNGLTPPTPPSLTPPALPGPMPTVSPVPSSRQVSN